MFVFLALSILTSTTYEIVGEDSLLFVQVFKDRTKLLSGMSHDHVIRAGSVSGTVILGPKTSSCAAALEIPVTQLRPDEPQMRRRLKLPTDLEAKDREEIRANMLAEDQLDADRFPNIIIELTHCKVGMDPSLVNLSVLMTVRGQTRSVSVDAEVTIIDGQLRARGAFAKRHTDFGFEPYSAAFGALKNRDEIQFVFDIVARRQ